MTTTMNARPESVSRGGKQVRSQSNLAQAPQSNDKCWGSLDFEGLLRELVASPQGLTKADARERLGRFGPNTLPRPRTTPWYMELGRQFVHVMALLLWAGAVLAWFSGMPELSVAIIGVLVINGLFSFWQQYKAERAIIALEALLPRQAAVLRDGIEQLVPAADLVPGDVLILSEGQSIPADARLFEAHRLKVDASSLTGESRPVPRTVKARTNDERPLTERPNFVLAGTAVVSGTGQALIYATGAVTEFGRLAALAQHQPPRPSPLEIEVRSITRLISIIALSMGGLFFVIGTLFGGLSVSAAFLFALGMIVANVPEGLLPTITLSLAMGVRRMAARNALVKRLEKVETLGSTTVILTDKTGTLTENEMTVRELWATGQWYRVTGVGYGSEGAVLCDSTASIEAARDVLRTAALCCDAKLRPGTDKDTWSVFGDPTEAALIVAAAKAGLSPESLAQFPRLSELPFDSTRKRMTTIQRIGSRTTACVKGAASQVSALATRIRMAEETVPFDQERRREFVAAHDALASRGLRVLAVAERDVEGNGNGWHAEEVEHDLILLGLVAMEDPPRPDVREALVACRTAGIRTMMITGDNGLTAATIGREIGLYQGDVRVVEGNQLDRLDDVELDKLLDEPELLFARVSPEHKLRLVAAYQSKGEVVAVTGDGVNDAPALRRADVGVAMGKSGTDVARAAADMVLTDDHFASIVWAIEEGRAVYDNIRKFITYILASNVPEAVPFVAYVLFRIPLPLTVMQILAVDLGTDLLPALALGAELPERDVMSRPPRPRAQRLLNRATLLRAYAWLGAIEAALCLLAFYFAWWWAGWKAGDPMADHGTLYVTATTMSLAGIVSCQLGNLFACRSGTQSILRSRWFSNPLMRLGLASELALLAALIYVPLLAGIFGLAPLGLAHWLFLAWFGPALLLLEELRKYLVRRRECSGR